MAETSYQGGNERGEVMIIILETVVGVLTFVLGLTVFLAFYILFPMVYPYVIEAKGDWEKIFKKVNK